MKGLIDQLIEEDERERFSKGLPLDVPAWQRLPFQFVVDLAASAIRLQELCESPIETQLGAKLLTWLPIIFPDSACELCPRGHQSEYPLECILVIPQYVRGNYRFDLAIERHRKVLVLIECDGKEFHSSEDQQARDEAKDESAERDGIRVLRFTGSQIFLRPDDCVSHVVWYLQQRGEMSGSIGSRHCSERAKLDPADHRRRPAPRGRELGPRPQRVSTAIN
jgi:very-short-patch-repair endonuclease